MRQTKIFIAALIVLSFFHVVSATAQEFPVHVTPSFKNPKTGSFVESPSGFLGMELTDMKAQLAFTFKLDKVRFGIKLTAFDRSMKASKSVELFNGDRTFGPFQPVLRKFNDKFYIVYFKFSEKGNADINAIAAEIDPVSLDLKKEVEFFSIPMKNYGLFKSLDLYSKVNFQVDESPDGSKLLAFWSSGADNEMILSVFDGELKSLWKKKEIAKYARDVTITSVCIDNSGLVFSTYKGEEKDKIYRLVVSDQKKRLEKDVQLEAGATPFQATVLPANAGGFVQLVGTYKKETDNLHGIFHQKLSIPDLKATSSTITPFTEELIERLDKLSWAETKSKKFGVNELWMNAIVTEGDHIAMAGSFSRIVHGQKATYHISGSILTVNFQEGKPVVSLIPRSRTSSGYNLGSGFMAVASKDKMVIFYNDYDKNVNKSVNEKFTDSNDPSILVLLGAVIEKDGSMKRHIVADLTREDFLLQPEKASILGNVVLMPGVEIKGMMGMPRDEGVLALITLR